MKGNLIILLVDDDEDDRKLFFEAAKEFDKTITEISIGNGLDALAYLRDESHALPDFIFLDLRMHRISGQKCLEEIKNDRRFSSIPVIIYTTSMDVDESIMLKKMGAAHFMTKPTSSHEVYYMLSVVLEENWS